jgi:hypothetical protein
MPSLHHSLKNLLVCQHHLLRNLLVFRRHPLESLPIFHRYHLMDQQLTLQNLMIDRDHHKFQAPLSQLWQPQYPPESSFPFAIWQ